MINLDLLPDAVVSPPSQFAALSSFAFSRDSSLFDIIDSIERRVIVEMLERCGWSQTDAADNFRIPLSTLNQKIKRHGIEIKRKRERAPSVPAAK
jgi:DNA-binding NtrC family response regulator